MALTHPEDEVAIGGEQVSDWIEITQAMIDTFADATGDRQFIHIDPARAAATPFGGTVAHGFLTLALMPLLASKVPGPDPLAAAGVVVNYGGNRVRFLTPVRAGSRVRGRFRTLAEEEKRPGQLQRTIEFMLEIEGAAKPALIAEWLFQVFD